MRSWGPREKHEKALRVAEAAIEYIGDDCRGSQRRAEIACKAAAGWMQKMAANDLHAQQQCVPQWQPPNLQRTPPKLSQPVGWPFPSQGEHGRRYNAGVLDALNGYRAPRTRTWREEMDVELDNYLSLPYLGRAEARNNHIKLLPAKLEVQVLEVYGDLRALYLAT